MLDYNIYLKDIVNSADKIEKTAVGKSEKELVEDLNLWDATLMRLQIIGESIKKMPADIKKKYKHIKWRKLSKLRNFISHKYSFVDEKIVWNVVNNIIPDLKNDILKVIENEKQ